MTGHSSGDSHRPDCSEERPRLLERDRWLSELGILLSNNWDRTVGPVAIEGAAGLGKTALLGAACQIASEAGLAVLSTRLDDPGSDPPRLVAEQLLDSLPTETETVSLRALPDADLHAELAKVVCRLAGYRGVLIAIDDAHWLDERSVQWLLGLNGPPFRQHMRLLMSVATRAPQVPLRPVEVILSEPGAQVMSLAPLSPQAVHNLVEECLCDPGQDLEQSFAQECYEATDGIPSLLVSLCRELMVEGVPPTAAGATRVAGITSQAVARSVLRGLSRLPLEATRVLEARGRRGQAGSS